MRQMHSSDAVHSDAVYSHAQVATRCKKADVIRDLRTRACCANMSGIGNRSILDMELSISNNSIQNLRKRHSSSFQAPPPKRRALIFKPGPLLAAWIRSFSEQAVLLFTPSQSRVQRSPCSPGLLWD